ncbi:MAG TPA: hypothetical protein VM938_07145 [Acidimicrobiales bacterium]|nr:hypothetical protein [Acidimicrobiales bacterium]
MPRKLTGSRWERGSRWCASVPEARGSRRRIEASFDEEAEREAWLLSAIAAVENGRQPPDPAIFRGRAAGDAPEANPRPLFEELAYGWLNEHYGQLRKADVEREHAVRALVDNHLIPAFAGPVPSDAATARRRLIEFVRRLAKEPEHRNVDAALLPTNELLSISEAAAVFERSPSTIRRALRAGKLLGARRGLDGQWLLPVSALAHALDVDRADALSRAYVRGILWVHHEILEWGRCNGWQIACFERGVNALTPDARVSRRKAGKRLRQPLAFVELARVAAHLHVIHQTTLWLMRVLGLRISEAYGPRVGDLMDLGDVGLLVVQRQGGRPFLTRTPDGAETVYSKDTLKRAASYRVVLVPEVLMALLRVVVAAFHTDPVTGEVDLNARLVPWIGREGAGQAAFRSALENALRQEGSDLESAGFAVVPHDLRKSLATDLAWDADLDELAKRRFMGHKAGDDVFARVYTLDHPTLGPLTEIARALEVHITRQMSSLMVPTEGRIRWRRANPLSGRAAHVDAVLAEAGWQVEPGDGDNPWCDAVRVAAEVGIAERTARRWMRDQVVPSVTDTDRFGNTRRRARLADVEAVRDRLAGRVLLRDLADELGCGYYRAYRSLRRLGLARTAEGPPPAELVLTPEEAAAVRAEFARLSALFGRSMRVSAAANRLGVAFGTAQRLVRTGQLVADEERDAFGALHVTKASVEAVLAARRPMAVDPGPLIDARVIASITGLNLRQLSDLAVQGTLVRHDHGRRFQLTLESVEAWAAGLGWEVRGTLATAAPAVRPSGKVVDFARLENRERGPGPTRLPVPRARPIERAGDGGSHPDDDEEAQTA